MLDDPLNPEPDVLLHVEARDELVTFYLSQARAAGLVYATVVKQLINRIYRDHDYLKRKEIEGKLLPYADVLRAFPAFLAFRCNMHRGCPGKIWRARDTFLTAACVMLIVVIWKPLSPGWGIRWYWWQPQGSGITMNCAFPLSTRAGSFRPCPTRRHKR